MPVLSNPRWERFAQARAKGKTATEAYEIAGFKPSDANAAHLSARPEIQGRIQELTGKAAERAVVTVESLIREVDEARELAMAINQPAAAIAAIKEKGVLSGKRVERSEQGLPGEFAELDGMSTDELRAYLTAEGEALSLRQQAAADGGRARGTGKSVH